MIPLQRPLTDADLHAVSTFVDQVVARGLMKASSVEIQTIRELVRSYGQREVFEQQPLRRD